MKTTLTVLIIMLSFSSFHSSRVSAEESKEECMKVEALIEDKVKIEKGLLPYIPTEAAARNNLTVDNRMVYYATPGLSFTLIKNGEIAWSEGYGVQSLETMKPVDCRTIFQAGSLSKPVTMIAAFLMAEKKLVDLDNNIQHYLKNYILPKGEQSEENPVTMRNLLSHYSGINRGGYPGYYRNKPFPTDLEVVMGTGVTNTDEVEVVDPPYEALNYSGGAYTVAEIAMQDIHNMPFSMLMDAWVLQPFGMSNAEFDFPLPKAKHRFVAIGHKNQYRPIKGGWRNHPEQAAAGMWATASDLGKFMVEIFRGYHGKSAWLSRKIVHEIISNRRDGHAYGFIVSGEGETLSITHFGGTEGYRSLMTINLATGDGAAFLANSDNGGELGKELVRAASKLYDWPNWKQKH